MNDKYLISKRMFKNFDTKVIKVLIYEFKIQFLDIYYLGISLNIFKSRKIKI